MNISNLFHFVISNFMMGVRPAAINDIWCVVINNSERKHL
jgi:hypothetical protein